MQCAGLPSRAGNSSHACNMNHHSLRLGINPLLIPITRDGSPIPVLCTSHLNLRIRFSQESGPEILEFISCQNRSVSLLHSNVWGLYFSSVRSIKSSPVTSFAEVEIRHLSTYSLPLSIKSFCIYSIFPLAIFVHVFAAQL